MAGIDPSYLVMTAADCAAYNEKHPHPIISLNQLLEVRAAEQADIICVGFIVRENGRLECRASTYAQLFDKVRWTAWLLHTKCRIQARSAGQAQPSIALLAPSCEEFLLNLFALFRLGWSVLLVAPQNTASDIAKLCAISNVTRLLYHSSMEVQARASQEASNSGLQVEPLVLLDMEKQPKGNTADLNVRSGLTLQEESDSECIIFHSSGSSGTPKPIPQKHRIWTKAACCKPHSPSFTTTPLFHGGISDLLRAMMSQSTLYLYPSTLPVTASNLLDAFKACGTCVTSFLSVPYILEMLAEVPAGLHKLASLELVSTGGSPLPSHVGDRLVQRGVKLVSRYGSSESGFLMSSYRPFDEDKSWSHLRSSEGSSWLNFEDQGDGTFELVVPNRWPTRNKSNREDGSYATSDLFTKHPSITNAWLLTGRSDDVILMSNGEKASPAPLENCVKRSPFVEDAVVFGSDRPSLGIAIVPKAQVIPPQDLSALLAHVNAQAPAHAQIVPELVLLLHPGTSLPKASKGSLQRGRAYEMLAEQISEVYDAYLGGTASDALRANLEGSELFDYILDLLKTTLDNADIREDDDLFNLGLTSLQAARVRNVLQSRLKFCNGTRLPANIVYDSSNARQLAIIVKRMMGGQSMEGIQEDADLVVMRQFSQELSLAGKIPERSIQAGNRSGRPTNYLVTGATGSLGAHLAAQIVRRREDNHVICFVRAKDHGDAGRRVADALNSHRLRLHPSELHRVRYYAIDFEDPALGLSQGELSDLLSSADILIHAAWPVHFGAGLRSFRPQLEGLSLLIKLASSHNVSLFFCSSTASALHGATSGLIPEKVSKDPNDAVPIGYGRSKWLAESICDSAWEAGMKGKVGILRLGQLSGDTTEGVWKVSEGWPRLYATATLAGCLPDLKETLSWLPVDCAAAAICDIAEAPDALVACTETPVFQLVSTSHSVSYGNTLSFAKQAGLRFDIVPVRKWLHRLDSLTETEKEHPSLQMLPVWQNNYGNSVDGPAAGPVFETEAAERYTSRLGASLTESMMRKLLLFWQSQGLVHLET